MPQQPLGIFVVDDVARRDHSRAYRCSRPQVVLIAQEQDSEVLCR